MPALVAWNDLLGALPDAVLIVDREARIVFANCRLADLTGFAVEELVGEPLERLIPKRSRVEHRRAVSSFLALPAARVMGAGPLTSCRTKDNHDLPVAISLAPFPTPDGSVIAIIRDDSDRYRTEQELFHRATHDPLTGLANRALVEDRLRQASDRSARRRSELTVLFLDLDHFKGVNDTVGHQVGDEVLRVTASTLLRTFRPGDTVSRLGGDEFLIVCEATREGEAVALAKRAVDAVRSAVRSVVPSSSVVVTASVGIAGGRNGEAPADLIARADAAMYSAKRAGGDGWSVSVLDSLH